MFTNKEFKGFKIELYFLYFDDIGMRYLDWARGKVVKLVNAKNGVVEIEWGKAGFASGDRTRTRQKPPPKMESRYRVMGAYTEYIEKLEFGS